MSYFFQVKKGKRHRRRGPCEIQFWLGSWTRIFRFWHWHAHPCNVRSYEQRNLVKVLFWASKDVRNSFAERVCLLNHEKELLTKKSAILNYALKKKKILVKNKFQSENPCAQRILITKEVLNTHTHTHRGTHSNFCFICCLFSTSRAHQTHYEQFGTIKGKLNIENVDEIAFAVEGVRDHSYGTYLQFFLKGEKFWLTLHPPQPSKITGHLPRNSCPGLSSTSPNPFLHQQILARQREVVKKVPFFKTKMSFLFLQKRASIDVHVFSISSLFDLHGISLRKQETWEIGKCCIAMPFSI